MKKLLALLLAACAAAAFALPAPAANANGGKVTITPVTSGLDSPRGLAFLPNGTLAVAEAGHGGDVCFPGPVCLGLTGQVSKVDLATGSHTPMVSGLMSLLDPEGGALGIDGLSAQGGRLLGIMGVFPQAFAGLDCSSVRAQDCEQVLAAARSEAGALLKLTPSGGTKQIANVGAFDYQFTVDNPGGDVYGTEEDANPYGLLAEPGHTYVADAGANTLDRVGNNGHISIVHRFVVPDPPEPFPTDAVPTCVARSGHHLVVADLAGRIWTVTDGGSATLISGPTDTPYTGGEHFTGCASDRAGNVYVVSMFNGLFPGPDVAQTGSIVKVTANGDVATLPGATGLFFPNGITVGPDGALYVTVGSITPNGGIVKITQ